MKNIIECKTEDLGRMLETTLEKANIISIVPYRLQTEIGSFPSPLQYLYVSTYLVIYCLKDGQDETQSSQL